MKVPTNVFKGLKTRLWAQADEDDWMTLADPQRSLFYEQWVRDERVGGVLSRYMDTGEIRVYLKDTIMKPYARERSKDPAPVLRLLGINSDEFTTHEFIKPHGRIFHDGKVVCWGPARNWKDVIMAVYERAKRKGKQPYAAVLMNPSGATNQTEERKLIADFAKRLGVERLEWFER
jgi:hypothetical protein